MDLARILSPLDDDDDTLHRRDHDSADDPHAHVVKRGRLSTTPTPTLPRAIVRDIVASLVHKLTRDDVVVAPGIELPSDLRAVACVSREWNAVAHDVTAELALSRLSVPVEIACRETLLALRRSVTLQRKYLVSLAIEKLPVVGAIGDGQWEAVLCHVPRLKKLSLGAVRDHRLPQLAEILRAAARQCDELHTLRMPSVPRPFRPHLRSSPLILQEFETALYGALAAWSKHGVRDGVRQLRVGMHYHITDVASARAYVAKLIELCPRVERIDGFQCSLNSYDGMRAHEQWLLDLPTWTTFCATLTNLTHFDWAFVPFATAFFDAFGQIPKPRLKKMEITPLVNWNWDTHLRGVDATTREVLTTTGYGATAVKAHTVLRACPNLQQLDVRWSYAIEDDDDEDENDEDENEEDEDPPVRKVMNPEIFGDDFCDALAQYCPQLESFVLSPLDDEAESNRVIRSLTDRAFRSLATLTWLHDVHIETPNITGAGLYELVVNHDASVSSRRRRYHVSVGEQNQPDHDHEFYMVLRDFLELVVAHDGALPCAQHTIFLQLVNKSPAKINRFWSEKYLKQITDLLEEIQARDPPAILSLTTNGYDMGTCSRIEDFAFSVGPDPEPTMTIDDDERVDTFLWDRVGDEDEPAVIEAMRRFYASSGDDAREMLAAVFNEL